MHLNETKPYSQLGEGKLVPYLECTQTALNTAYQHAQSSPQMEICGICFGRVEQQLNEDLRVSVELCWPAQEAVSDVATVSFTYESWALALDYLDELRIQSPDYGWRIVGWYHSHPGFGIFFSSVDRHSHTTYFPKPWHVALVIDPHNRRVGWFGWDSNEIVPLNCSLIEDSKPEKLPEELLVETPIIEKDKEEE